MADTNQYADRDHRAQGDYYLRHVSAMTGDGLHAKSAIAGELAHRDMVIDAQAAEIERLRTDAERYRWLRSLEWFAEAEIGIELDGSAWRVTFSSPAPFENASGGSWLDAAIDAARKEADRA